MFSHGKNTDVNLSEIKVSEGDLLHYYIGINKIPCVIKSPLRTDNRPSFGLYSLDGVRVFYKDLSTQETGSTFTLLSKLFGLSFHDTLKKIKKDIDNKSFTIINTTSLSHRITQVSETDTKLEVKIREWRDYDIEYWESYGVTLTWLKWAEIYPISHKIVIKDNHRYVFSADKYAYAFIERKEGNITLKIYQPFNTSGYKWSNKHDRSVISLWTKVPEYGKRIVICSSMKDALCLSCNTNIPALAIQGEGYMISNTAINELKRRFEKQYILLDNDEAGIKDAEKLSIITGFKNIVLPQFKKGKDLSDYYKIFGKEKFKQLIKQLFKDGQN
jgi:hypothetical protein